ncbi:hypothetical protein [Klebsiella aerogenes]|uniref:hypothetical protein n=1 Tax=Klebsiella aerogenes TaxID=548 RepID=UPI00351D63A3
MKTAVEMLEDVSAEMTDATSTLEFLYKHSSSEADIDSGICCVVRSLLSTINKTYSYIELLSVDNTKAE